MMRTGVNFRGTRTPFGPGVKGRRRSTAPAGPPRSRLVKVVGPQASLAHAPGAWLGPKRKFPGGARAATTAGAWRAARNLLPSIDDPGRIRHNCGPGCGAVEVPNEREAEDETAGRDRGAPGAPGHRRPGGADVHLLHHGARG